VSLVVSWKKIQGEEDKAWLYHSDGSGFQILRAAMKMKV
jgi:hypothetical protein